MTKQVDARGLACPQPVIQTRNALKEHREIVVIVDNETAQKNVTRMAERSGATVEVETRDDGIYLHITRKETEEKAEEAPQAAAAPVAGPRVLIIPSQYMGRGEHEELGDILIRGFFHTLGEVTPSPDTVIFFNSGVKLVTEDSPILEDLRALEEEGLEILACGTCLDYYGLEEEVAVGVISNMYTIAETILGAGKVISL
ncbi:MAG: sulfurtransferase-like selenium metabolism protein YedF [Chloroflexota bacterium]